MHGGTVLNLPLDAIRQVILRGDLPIVNALHQAKQHRRHSDLGLVLILIVEPQAKQAGKSLFHITAMKQVGVPRQIGA